MIDLHKLIGGGYNKFWHSKHRFIVIKGSRASKKTTTVCTKLIYRMMEAWGKYKLKPHVLVIRQYYNTHKNSTRQDLIKAINRLGVRHLWHIPKGENTLTYIPSGQTILFRGMDDPESISGITVSEGFICWVWFEEASQLRSEKDFDKVELSIRGKIHETLYKQFILTLNPWSDKHWIKKRFFDMAHKNVLALTTNYLCNEFLGDDDLEAFNDMKERFPRRYTIEGLGEWGISEGLIFSNWEVQDFDINQVAENKNYISCNGLDFGYNDPTAFVACKVDTKNYIIYIYDDFCETMMSNQKIANTIQSKGFSRSLLIADSEDQRTINELKRLGCVITGAKKGQGSVLYGLQKLEDYKIIVHGRCQDTIIAFENYAWEVDKKTGETLNKPCHEYSHIPDALRYATEGIGKFGIKV